MNDPKIFENPCAICKVREATQLCDFIVHYDRSIIFFKDYKLMKEHAENGFHDTCDLPICKECSYKENGADFCPHHHDLLKQVELPKKYRKYQLKQKAKLYMGR
jgi:hypothetical protein